MKKLNCFWLLFIFLNPCAFSNQVHTIHHIYALNDSSNLKPWHIKITEIAPNESAYFIANNITSDNLNFDVKKDNPIEYGFGFSPTSNFDIAYTVTAIDSNQSSDAFQHHTKSCTFVVTANGPADPNITVVNYQDAQCTYKVISGQGEDFYLK